MKLNDHLVMLPGNSLYLDFRAYGRITKPVRLDGVVAGRNSEKFEHTFAIGLGCAAGSGGRFISANEIDGDTLDSLTP